MADRVAALVDLLGCPHMMAGGSIEEQLDVVLLKLLDVSGAIVGTVDMLSQPMPLTLEKRVLLMKHLRALNVELSHARRSLVLALVRYQQPSHP